MKRIVLLSLIGLLCLPGFSQKTTLPPDQLYGRLFLDVQLFPVFHDSKTFVDCTPRVSPEEIVSNYRMLRKDTVSKKTLEKFVNDNFILPMDPPSGYVTGKSEPVEKHINNLWKVLKRTPDRKVAGGSLLPLPYSYIVPGGRFR